MSSSEEPTRDLPGVSAVPERDTVRGWGQPHPGSRVEPWPEPGTEGFVRPWSTSIFDDPRTPSSTAPRTDSFGAHPGDPRHTAWAYGATPPPPGEQPIISGYGPHGPEASPRRRGHSGWVLAAAAVVAAGALTGLLATPAGRLPSLTGPGTVHPSAVPTDTPLPTPADVLKKNSVYALTVTGGCPSQRIPSSWKTFQSQVRALVECENKAWGAALDSVPMAFSKPKVVFYSKAVDSPCGHLNSTFPASYCSGNHTLYFSRASYQQGRYYRLSVSEFVFHEYAHHVQDLAGIFLAADQQKEDDEATERRIELQAHCIAHYRLTHAGLKFSAKDRADVEYQLGYSADAKGHGSAKAGRYWGELGLDAKKIGACNTWKAKASLVK